MSDQFKAVPVDAYELHEVAEALGVPTVSVMAMLNEDFVLYTPDMDSLDIWGARLGRDADGILRAGGKQFVSTEAQFHAEMKVLIEKAMKRNLDE